MTDTPPDTPYIPRNWCPICEPDVDPTRECVQETRCYAHWPTLDGVEDRVPTEFLTHGEAGGEDNKLWCDFVHGRTTDARTR